MQHPGRWRNDFTFRGQRFFYNRIPHNNFAERAVEIPLALDFLAHIEQGKTILEVGNVLSYYENPLSQFPALRPRRIIDKFESGTGVERVDLMDLPADERYHAIVSISTVEHIGQGTAPTGEFGEVTRASDREAPLKAIAKIYQLLHPGGKALITVPFGKLTDGGWFIQFSSAYLDLLVTTFGIPRAALRVDFMKRTAIQLGNRENNPLQVWVEAREEELGELEFKAAWNGASAIALLELKKLSEHFALPARPEETQLTYALPILISTLHYGPLITQHVHVDHTGALHSEERGLVFDGFYHAVAAGEYELTFVLQMDTPGDFLFEFLLMGKESRSLQASMNDSCTISWQLSIPSGPVNLAFRLLNCSGKKVKLTVPTFLLRQVR